MLECFQVSCCIEKKKLLPEVFRMFFTLPYIPFSLKERSGGTYVLDRMLNLPEISTEMPLNLSLLLVLTGEEMKESQCCKGYMVLHGRMKSS